MLMLIRKYYYLIFFGFIFAFPPNQETGWKYRQSTSQTFYMFENIHVDGEVAFGDGVNPSTADTTGVTYSAYCILDSIDCDVVGVFINRNELEFGFDFNYDNEITTDEIGQLDLNDDGEITSSAEICLGWTYADSLGFTTIPIMGRDSGQNYALAGYAQDGDLPYLKIYDASNDVILPLEISNVYYEENFDDCGYDNVCPSDDDYSEPDQNGSENNGIHDPIIPAEPFTDCIPGNTDICEGDAGFMPWHDDNTYAEGEPFEDTNANGVWDDAIEEEFNTIYDYNSNGIWDSYIEGELVPFTNLGTYVYGGALEAFNDFGCMDPEACDYDPDATADDGTCSYPPMGDIPYTYNVIDNSIELSWGAPAIGTPDTYEVSLLLLGDEVDSNQDAESPLVFSNLQWSASYDITITATNVCGSTMTSIDDIQIGPIPTPEAPVLNTPQGSEALIFLSWSEVEHASIYRIFSNDELIDSTSSYMYSHSNLAPGTIYSYKIKAVNPEEASGSFSNEESGVTDELALAQADSLIAGQGSLRLYWSMEGDVTHYANSEYKFQIEMNECSLDDADSGECTEEYQEVENDGESPHYESSLDADTFYCFRATPYLELNVDDSEVVFYSNLTNSICGTPEEISGWLINLEATIHGGWTADQMVEDSHNYLGMSPHASDDYDYDYDIFEPPLGGSDLWISLSFPHPEWGVTVGDLEWDLFTTDVRKLRDLSRTPEVWDLQLEFPPPGGNVSLGFDFESDAGGHPVFLKQDDQYQRITDEDSVSFTPQSFESGSANSLSIIVGNQPPSAPNLNFIETQNSRSIILGWDGYEECIDDSELCNNYANRYPSTSYKIYRQWLEEQISRVVGIAGALEHRIIIFPHDLAVASEEDFELIDEPENGDFEIEYFEPCEESDCGWDGLCPGDEGYDGPDLGEQDGICNQVYYYEPSSLGADSLSYKNGIYDLEESFTDSNGNGQYDLGEDFEDGRELKINITSNIPTSYLDYDLRTGTSYTYNISGSNTAGDSELSFALSASSGENTIPEANPGVDQSRYILSADLNTIDCIFPLSIIGFQENSCDENGENCINIFDNVNLSFDPDSLSGETLEYEWEIRDPYNYLGYDDYEDNDPWFFENQIFPSSEDADDYWWRFSTNAVDVLTLTLPDEDELGVDENNDPILFYPYSVRLRVKDASGYWSFYEYITATVTRNVPEPADVEYFEGDESLYYIDLSWDRSSYDDPTNPDADGTNFPADPGYCVSASCNGLPELAEYYVVYRDSYYVDYSSSSALDCEGEWMLGGDYQPEEYCRMITYTPIVELDDQLHVSYECENSSFETEFDTYNECITSCGEDGCREFFEYSDSWLEELSPSSQNPIGEAYIDLNENGRWDDAICEIDETTCNIIREEYGLSEEDIDFENCACTFSYSACAVLGGVFESGHCTLYNNNCTDLGGGFTDREEYSDENFNDTRDSNESHRYFVVAFNGTGASEPCGYIMVDGQSTLSGKDCLPSDDFIIPDDEYKLFSTGSLPIPTMTSPCGGEIMASGSQESIDWDFNESDVQHVKKVRIEQSQDSGNSWNTLVDEAALQFPYEYEFTVMETDTISFYNKFRVEVIDEEDQVHIDETDYLIIIANNELQNTYNKGYSAVSSPLLLGTLDLVPANGIIYQRVYDDLTNDFSFEELDPSAFDSIENGQGYYLLTSRESIDLEIQGDILPNETIALRPGWNLIGNPLVARFPIEWLEVIDAQGDILSWSGAIDEHKIMPYIFGFDNGSREHRPVDIIDPFYGYWVYASEDLELSFEPRVYDESLYDNERGAYWGLTLHASIHLGSYTSMGDQIVVGFSDVASDLFEYGVDAYDLEGPEDVGAPTSVDLYVDHSSDWENIESSRFYSDIRSSSGLSFDDPIVWDIAGNKEGQSASDSVLIAWNIENEGLTYIDNKDVFFQYNDTESRCACPDVDGDEIPDECYSASIDQLCEFNSDCPLNEDEYFTDEDGELITYGACLGFTTIEIVDMKIQDSIVIPVDAFEDPMKIVVVPIDTSCGGQGLEQCANGECGSEDLGGTCTCAQNLLDQCADNTCGSLEDGSCTCEQDELGTTCADDTCGSLEDGSCTCEQNYLFDCYGDGQCYELSEDLNNDLSITIDDCPCIGEDCEDTNSNNAVPDKFSLSAPYPNPFNPSMQIDFSLPAIDNINISIYDINGEYVDNIMSGFKTAGFYTAYWNASSMPTGIYFISFSSKEVNKTMKVVLVK